MEGLITICNLVWKCAVANILLNLAAAMIMSLIWFGWLGLDEWYVSNIPDYVNFQMYLICWVFSFILVYVQAKNEELL